MQLFSAPSAASLANSALKILYERRSYCLSVTIAPLLPTRKTRVNMHRLTLVIAGLLLASIAVAQDEDYSKVQMKVTKVAGSVYMLEGAGGNIGASVGEDGIVIVDDQYAPLANKIQAALKELKITDKPVRFVINTHYHGDHTGGNEPFANVGSTVIAHDNVRKRLETGGTAGNG